MPGESMKSSSTTLPVRPTDRRRALLALAALAVWPLRGLALGRGMAAVAGMPPASPLRLPDADGKPVDLAAYRGKVVLVNFWATWCPPCRQELPSLSRLKKRFAGEAFEILSVNIGEDVDTVFDFAGNPPYPMLFDHDSKAMAAWPVKGVPTTLLVDRHGRLAYRAVGGREFDDAEVVALIGQLLKA